MFNKDSGQFNSGKFKDVDIFQPPSIRKFPCITSQQRKRLACKLDYEVDQCRLDDSFIGAVYSDADTSILSLGSNIDTEYMQIFASYIDDNTRRKKYTKLNFRFSISVNKNIINDDAGELLAQSGESRPMPANNRLKFNEVFDVNLSLINIHDRKPHPWHDYYINIIICDQNSKPFFWCNQQIFKNQSYELRYGNFTKKLYLPPVQKPPIEKPEKVKIATAKINFTVQFKQPIEVIDL